MLNIRLITVSNKPPAWISEGFREYVKRLSPACTFDLIEIPVEKRNNQKNMQPYIEKEGEKIVATLKPGHTVIALDVTGKMWSTEKLAEHFAQWQQQEKGVDLIVGGPDGLSATCLARAQTRWSLSALTFPHLFIRVLIAEQIYRAWSITQGHPYHK